MALKFGQFPSKWKQKIFEAIIVLSTRIGWTDQAGRGAMFNGKTLNYNQEMTTEIVGIHGKIRFGEFNTDMTQQKQEKQKISEFYGFSHKD